LFQVHKDLKDEAFLIYKEIIRIEEILE